MISIRNDEAKTLASTLRKNGIAATDMDARRMAEEMLRGSKQVIQDQDTPARAPVQASPAPKQEQEQEPVAEPSSSHLEQQIDELKEKLEQREQHISKLSEELNQLKESVNTASHQVDQFEQDNLLNSTKPINELTDTQQVTSDINTITSQPYNASEQEVSVERELEPVQQDNDINIEEFNDQVHHLSEQSDKDKQLYEEEQEDIGFIGEDADNQINTQADAPPETTQEIPAQNQNQRGRGLTKEEEDMTDISRIFQFGK